MLRAAAGVVLLDDWGYPIVGEVPDEVVEAAREAVRACPAPALRLRIED